MSIPQPRIDRLLAALSAFKGNLPYVTPRLVASIVGKIISLSPCVGNVSLIMSRFLQSAVSLRDAWDTPLDLSRFQHYLQCVYEIAFWLVNCPKLNCKKLFEYTQPVCIIGTDASDFACGGHALFVDKEEFDLFYNAFPPWNRLLTVMEGSYSPFFTRLGHSSRLSRVKLSNCILTVEMLLL